MTDPKHVKLQDALGFTPDYTDVSYSYNAADNTATLKANTSYVYVATVNIAKKGTSATFGKTTLEEGTYAFKLDTYDSTTSRNVVESLNGATMWRSFFNDSLTDFDIQNSAWIDNTDFANASSWDYTGTGWGMTLSNLKVYRLTQAEYDALGLSAANKGKITTNALSSGKDVTAEYKETITDLAAFKTTNLSLKNNTGLSKTGDPGQKLILDYEGKAYITNSAMDNAGLSENITLVKQADGKLGLTEAPDKALTITSDGVVKAGDTIVSALAITGEGNDIITSSAGNDWINAGSDYDTIKFNGSFGSDTITVNEKETFNLEIGDTSLNDVDTVSRKVAGDDVILSTKVKYYATIKVSGTGYGKNFGTGDNATTYTLTLQELAIKDAGMTETPNILAGKYGWKATESYGTIGAQNTPCYVALDNGEAYLACNGTNVNFGGATISDFVVYKQVNDGEPEVITDEYKAALLEAGTTTVTAIDADSYDDSVAAQYYNAQTEGTITLRGYAKTNTDNGLSTINGDEVYNIGFTPDTEEITKGSGKNKETVGTKFTGSRFNEVAESTSLNDVFELGKSVGSSKDNLGASDTVVFSGNFGDDTVKLSEGETLNLNFTIASPLSKIEDTDDFVVATISGSDLKLTANVEYIAEATVNGKLWGNDVAKDTKYTFKLGQYTDTQFNIPNLNDKYMWKGQASYGKVGDKDRYWAIDNTLFKGVVVKEDGTCTIEEAGATATNFAIYEVVNGEKRNITKEYVKALGDVVNDNYKTQPYDDSVARALYNSQLNGTITVEGYAKKSKDSTLALSINVEEPEAFAYEIVPDKNNKFTGTSMDDYARSTGADTETFDLKTGYDTIDLSGAFGKDIVTLTKGETVNLEFDINEQISNINNLINTEVVGNDLVVSTKTVKYIAKADVYGTAWGSTINQTGTTTPTDATHTVKYTFELAPFTIKNDNPTDDEKKLSGKILWRSNESYGTYKNYDRHFAIENHAFDTTTGTTYDAVNHSYTFDTDIAGGATITNFKIYEVVDGEERDITGTYVSLLSAEAIGAVDYANYDDSLAESLYDAETLSGTVTVKNFAKDNGARLQLNGEDFIYTVEGTKAMQEIAKNKGKLNGSSGNDAFNLTEYISNDGVKGVTVNSGSGNDNITGSKFNDVINVKSLANEMATVTQTGGNNKVTLGKGNDTYTGSDYASSNVNAGSGDNTVTINAGSYGSNNITAGNGHNNITLNGAVNTVKVGNATDKATIAVGYDNQFAVGGGLNKITSGKGADKFTIGGGNNTISSGAGKDTFTITDGYNTIKTGADDKTFVINTSATMTNSIVTGNGKDKFTVAQGTNVIKSGAGDDEFTVTGGKNAIDGGAGADTYNLNYNIVGAAGKTVITDTNGANTFNFADKATNIFFDVTNVKTDKNGKVVSYKIGNEFILTDDGAFKGFGGLNDGVDIKVGAKNSINNSKVKVGNNNYKFTVDELASTVAGWLTTNKCKSVAEVFDKGTDTQIAQLNAVFTDFDTANKCYTAPGA